MPGGHVLENTTALARARALHQVINREHGRSVNAGCRSRAEIARLEELGSPTIDYAVFRPLFKAPNEPGNPSR